MIRNHIIRIKLRQAHNASSCDENLTLASGFEMRCVVTLFKIHRNGSEFNEESRIKIISQIFEFSDGKRGEKCNNFIVFILI